MLIPSLFRSLSLISALATTAASATGPAPAAPPVTPMVAATPAPVMVRMETTKGTIVLRLDPERAPKSVANFLGYVNSGFYQGLIFHRVISRFMAQGGGYDEQFRQPAARPAIQNEAGNGLFNIRGSIAMARTSFPHSATSEFYINLADNPNLDYPSFDGWGYAVFGTVIEGMDVVDKMAAIPTGPAGPFPTDVPLTPIVIKKVSVIADVSAQAPAPNTENGAPTPLPGTTP